MVLPLFDVDKGGEKCRYAQTQGEYHTSCQEFAIIKKGEFVKEFFNLN